MTFEDYITIKANANQAIEEAKKIYEAAVAQQKEIIRKAANVMANDTAKFKKGDLVRKGNGKTTWKVVGMNASIYDGVLYHFYSILPVDSKHFRYSEDNVSECHLTKVENA